MSNTKRQNEIFGKLNEAEQQASSCKQRYSTQEVLEKIQNLLWNSTDCLSEQLTAKTYR